MASKDWVTFLTVSGSIILFASWLNENTVEKNLNERLRVIQSYSQKIAESRIENAILETRLWNIRSLFINDTANKDLKVSFYNNIIKYQSANLKIDEIANDGYQILYPDDTSEINKTTKNLEDRTFYYKKMLEEDSVTSKQLDHEFMNTVVKEFYTSVFNAELFEGIYNMNHEYDYELNFAYRYRLWLYIIGSLCLSFAYIIHRRNE
jgi:hypothetical protein